MPATQGVHRFLHPAYSPLPVRHATDDLSQPVLTKEEGGGRLINASPFHLHCSATPQRQKARPDRTTGPSPRSVRPAAPPFPIGAAPPDKQSSIPKWGPRPEYRTLRPANLAPHVPRPAARIMPRTSTHTIAHRRTTMQASRAPLPTQTRQETPTL